MPIIHFLITNYAVWQFMDWYPHTLGGLYETYLMGLPFLKNMLIGTIGYSAIFFGIYELTKYIIVCTKKSLLFILPR